MQPARVTSISEGRKEQSASDLLPLFEQYLLEGDYSGNTLRGYLGSVQAFLAWYQAEEKELLTMASLTAIALVGYRNALQNQHKAPATINKQISALKAWCQWLVDQGYIASDPAARVKLVAIVRSSDDRRGLSAPQMNALLRQAQQSRLSARNYAIVQLMFQTGIRVSEVVALTLDDLVFQGKGGKLLVRQGKGRKAREVPLNTSAKAAIAGLVWEQLGASTSKIEDVAKRWPARRSDLAMQPLFLSQKGGSLTTHAIGVMIDELVEASGDLVPEWVHPHTLRHTFARNYLTDNPGDIFGLANILGHSSVETTRLYADPTTQQLADRIERMASNAYE